MSEEREKLTECLKRAANPPGAGCLADSVLAEYLDGGPGENREAARARIEGHLAGCLACQARLVALYREVRALLDTDTVLETREQDFAGEQVDFEEGQRRVQARNAAASANEPPVEKSNEDDLDLRRTEKRKQ